MALGGGAITPTQYTAGLFIKLTELPFVVVHTGWDYSEIFLVKVH